MTLDSGYTDVYMDGFYEVFRTLCRHDSHGDDYVVEWPKRQTSIRNLDL